MFYNHLMTIDQCYQLHPLKSTCLTEEGEACLAQKPSWSFLGRLAMTQARVCVFFDMLQDGHFARVLPPFVRVFALVVGRDFKRL